MAMNLSNALGGVKKKKNWWDTAAPGVDQYIPEPVTPPDPTIHENPTGPFGLPSFPKSVGDPFKTKPRMETDSAQSDDGINLPYESPAGRPKFGGGQPGDPIAPGGAENSWPGYYPGQAGQEKAKWLYDPMTGKLIGGGTGADPVTGVTPGTTPTTKAAYDFWASMGDLLIDPNGDISQEDVDMLRSAWEEDPKWKPPTGASAQRLMKTAKVLKTMGYEDQLGEVVGKLLDMGYSQPKWSLSLFNSLLSPYGLGVGTGTTGTSAK
jgi:hypothetical protein